MIECPYCKVYWDYVSKLPHYVKSFLPLKLEEELKEQKECIEHVARDHAYVLMLEKIENDF